MSRINFMEETIKREEKLRVELRDKLRVSEDNNRELTNFIKSI